MRPLIEEFFLGESNLEAYYTCYPLSAMALQPNMASATKRARVFEAHGYHRRPPRGGRRHCFAVNSLDPAELDEVSIRATARGVETEATPEEIEEVREAYRASEFGDAYWIAFDTEMHIHTVVAILRYLAARDELPAKGF